MALVGSILIPQLALVVLILIPQFARIATGLAEIIKAISMVLASVTMERLLCMKATPVRNHVSRQFCLGHQTNHFVPSPALLVAHTFKTSTGEL